MPVLTCRLNTFFSILILGIWANTSCTALFASDFFSPRSAGLGGAGHAGPSLGDSLYLNPAYGSLIQASTVSMNYLGFTGGGTLPDGSPEYTGHQLNVSMQDGRSELFQAGVGYTQRGDANILTLGASKNPIQTVGIGLGGKFFFPADSRTVIHDATIATTVVATDWLQLVGVVDNLFQTPEGLAHGLVREYILGTKINVMNIALLYFDPHLTPALSDTYGHELGIEFALGSDLFLRFGRFLNSAIPYEGGARGNGYGWGLGWITPRMFLDYGMSRAMEPINETAHTVGTTLYF